MKLNEAAKLARLSKGQMMRLAREKKIKATEFNGHYDYDRDSVKNYRKASAIKSGEDQKWKLVSVPVRKNYCLVRPSRGGKDLTIDQEKRLWAALEEYCRKTGEILPVKTF